MDVRVGVTHAKEIVLELPEDADQDKLIAEIETALSTESGVLWITDRRGRRVGVPSDKLAYVEIGKPQDHRVGFVAP